MNRLFNVLVFLFVLSSCVPIRIAPKIDDYKISKGKKFKRTLSKRQLFIFKDTKEAGEFYKYVNTKFQLHDSLVYDDVPFQLENQQYFFATYEVEIQDKSFQLVPIALDVLLSTSLGSDEVHPLFSNSDGISRKGNFYIAIEVYSDLEKDCLLANSFSRTSVLKYLRQLKKEYLATHNYNEILFKN
ncbi:hypothetical protein I2486_07590 [Cellulophaga sp. E16_2]|uniref:hypothetical protein n=1 Tax=Cellulophaga sp. E16_2 TaxID=2789297 RepID=UPI001A92E149|nr:hypothetical protein [Cellulophaga sp. E16_2]MBO0591269.1 hypothetical protein [Cellulophaga sp. E16_2]